LGIHLVQGGVVSLMVADVARAVDFYTRALEFNLRSRRGEDYAEVELEGLRVGLSRTEAAPARRGHAFPMSIALDVERLDGAMLVLRERGVQFAPDVAERDGQRFAFFTDLDGTPLYLREATPPRKEHG
jgi:catechol 2,3-dioxygenase-like lactoylglutathione lyase family enzyme